ncbi:MAG: putative Na+/H+ antiporter [Puniceicoccales bacterium]|jgi:Na+/H+ antiporter NhaD/arsenite permease-like protein|nr:putative Na+/H+ antiporter [Puniceicoccales bacterium]
MRRRILFPLVCCAIAIGCILPTLCRASVQAVDFPISIQKYQALEAGKNLSLFGILKHRVALSPFNLIATILFFGAIGHTFLASKFASLAEKIAEKNGDHAPGKYFLATVCHFLGEVEAIFGIWAIPLLIFMAANFGWHAVGNYFNGTVSFAEPIFVVVIVAIAATRPILSFAEAILGKIAGCGGGTVAAWWLSILMVAPFMGSFITEPAAMTIGAMLLAKRFYRLAPSWKLRYATLGLLFVNVSVGGTLTHFAAPPILMVAHKWNLTTWKVFSMLGAHAVIGVAACTLLYYAFFRKEFVSLQAKSAAVDEKDPATGKIPFPVTAFHCLFLAWTVVNLHTSALVVAGFLFFLAFAKATKKYQDCVNLKSPVLVGFFLAGLVTHGGLQEWWISPVLGSLREFQLFIGATLLTAFNDNAAITYLSSLVSEFAANAALQKAVLAGAVSGGGLTVIANAPNPAGQNILAKYFDGSISPLRLIFGAAMPTAIVAACFNLW